MTIAKLWLLLLPCILPGSVLWLGLVVNPIAMSPDGLALLAFKGNLSNGDVLLSTWNASDDGPCGGYQPWRGVTCVWGSNHSVSGLSLVNLDLEGEVSSTLGVLANLTHLDLSRNRLSGQIPPEIAAATRLMELKLSQNLLTGSIPADINNLRSLEILGLDRNSLSGSIPALDGLTNLTQLWIDGNDLSGPLPNVTLLTKLVRMHIGTSTYNHLVAPGGQAPDLANLVDLESILLGGCHIGGPMPTWIAGLRSLRVLHMDVNLLSGPIPEDIWANKVLQNVELSSNRLNGSIPAQLLGQLQPPARAARKLNLSYNALTGHIPDTLNTKKMPDSVQLTTIDLSNNQLEGPIPSTFARAEFITRLWLHNNRLSGDITSADWAGPPFNSSALSELRLQGNLFTGLLGPATCQRWQQLKILDLSGNTGIRLVDDSLSFMLNNLSLLEELRLSNVRGSGKLPTSHRTAPFTSLQLTVLDLSRSGLAEDLSQSPLIANAEIVLPSLQSLDLSGNGLTGGIPLSFTRMPNLSFLNLSDNLLSGGIPNLSLLPNLRSLDLSGNRLSGKIALNFTLMPNLTFLNLSNNRLSGRIPNLPPHLLNAASFAGNRDLCGPPLLRRCRNTLVVKLAAGLVACVLLFAGTCLFFAWRLRRHSKRHRQDADLIAILQGRTSANLMPLADLRKATSNFSKACQIGVGGFGEVYKGKLDDGTLVAIKKSKRQGSQRDKDQFLNEVKILSQVNHRNLVQLLGCCLANKVALLVFEFVPNGTLEEHLRSTTPGAPPLTWMERLRIALQTADALAYLHSAANPPIFHRDVKSANILLDQNVDAKVADFGISKLAPLDATHVSTAAVQGTRGYIDPEYYVSFQLTAKSDVFSFGVVLLELISGRSPLEPERGSEDASLIGVAVPLIKSGKMEEVIDPSIFLTSSDLEKVKESVVAVGALAVKCLELKSKDRPNMREVFKDLQILRLEFDASTVFDISDQRELGSGLSDLVNPPDDNYIEFLNSRSFHGCSTTRTLSSLRKLADIEEQMASLNR